MASYPTRFASTLDLARLPWFELVDGELSLADPALGPSIDVHTHLGMSFVLPSRIDLGRRWPATEHYLPVTSPLDLEVYANRNFSPAELATLGRDLTLKSLTAGGMRRTHTAPNLLGEMKRLGVVGAVLLAIDLPLISDNTRRWAEAARGHDELVLFGSLHPLVADLEGTLDRQLALGIRGVKLHPAMQLFHPSGPLALRLYRACGRRGLPVLWHCGPVGIEPALGRWLTQVEHYRAAIEKNPETTFVLGHSGALQLEAGIELARRYDNVWLEIASQSLSGVRTILDKVDPRRVMVGSDWPFYHLAMPLAKLFIATEGAEALRRDVQYHNAARLLGLAPAEA
ncbi:MAG: amidohydrolase family protein [Polyangiaceae bacterium]|nr:amidohydrolase family protein [Polyangiaceae bacterium]